MRILVNTEFVNAAPGMDCMRRQNKLEPAVIAIGFTQDGLDSLAEIRFD